MRSQVQILTITYISVHMENKNKLHQYIDYISVLPTFSTQISTWLGLEGNYKYQH